MRQRPAWTGTLGGLVAACWLVLANVPVSCKVFSIFAAEKEATVYLTAYNVILPQSWAHLSPAPGTIVRAVTPIRDNAIALVLAAATLVLAWRRVAYGWSFFVAAAIGAGVMLFGETSLPTVVHLAQVHGDWNLLPGKVVTALVCLGSVAMAILQTTAKREQGSISDRQASQS